MTKLTHGSLFSGVGGIDAGLDWAGYETAWQVEIDPYARKVLEKHWPGVQRFEDVRGCGKHNLEPVEILSGGFPCQDESIAGKKRGFGIPGNPTKRSGLWFEFHRIIRELRPRWVLIENVSRLLNTEDGNTVLSQMEEAGYTWWSLRLPAEYLGVPHGRERAWLLCHDNARGRCDIGAAMGGGWTLPPGCRRKLEEARERWDRWKLELGGGAGQGCPARITTPTATAILEAEWPSDGRFYRTASGRWRKRSKVGTDSSMSWVQEMAVRAAAERNLGLAPTPEVCEDFMGLPRGWTGLGEEPLGSPWEGILLAGEESDAYARIARGVRGIPDWEDRLRCCGNAAVPHLAMLIGACVRHHEVRLAAGEDPSAQPGMGRSARSACPARLAGPRGSGGETGSAAAAQGMPETEVRPDPAGGASAVPGCQGSGGGTGEAAHEKPEPPDKCPEVEVVRDSGKEQHARAMGDAELCEFITEALSPA
jgi:DNA-cytosine methyltransferase